MTIQQYNEYGKFLDDTLRLETYPIAVKFFDNLEDIPKDAIFAVMKAINEIVAPAPIAIGDVLCENIAGTGVALTATKAVEKK